MVIDAEKYRNLTCPAAVVWVHLGKPLPGPNKEHFQSHRSSFVPPLVPVTTVLTSAIDKICLTNVLFLIILDLFFFLPPSLPKHLAAIFDLCLLFLIDHSILYGLLCLFT